MPRPSTGRRPGEPRNATIDDATIDDATMHDAAIDDAALGDAALGDMAIDEAAIGDHDGAPRPRRSPRARRTRGRSAASSYRPAAPLPDAFAVASRRGTFALCFVVVFFAPATIAAIATSWPAPGPAVVRPLDLVASALPVLLVAFLVRADVHRRWTWVMLTAALGLLAVALVWQHSLDPLGWSRPSDSIRLAGTALLVVAIGLVGRGANPSALRSDRLDGLILVLGVAAGLMTMWNGPLDALVVDVDTARLALVTVCIDVALLGVAMTTVSAVRYRPSLSAVLMVLGALCLLAADLTWLRTLLDTGSLVGSLARPVPDAPHGVIELRLLSILLFACAAWLPKARRNSPPDRLSQITIIPVLSSLVALMILGAGIVGDVNTAASLLALATIASIVLRTAVTVHELHTGSESYRLARTDELTSLTNRRGFLEGLDRLIQVAPLNVAVMIIDLNGFKEVNDSLGHHAGDELLRLVADRFRPVVGSAGLLARLGGDEFGVVILVPDKTAALAGATLLQRSLDEPFQVDGLSVRVGAAIGVALYPSHSRTRSGVLRSADVAMYDAKTRRTGVELYHPASDFRTRDKLQLLEDLRAAIEHRQLSLFFQPKVGLTDGTITSAEALVRWEHPTKGMLMPDDFVPLAERAGLVPGLTRAVLAQAISFHAERCPHVGVSVNISHRDVVDDDLAVYISDLLQIYGYPAAKLTLEITETELAHDPMRAARSIAHLRAAGIRISIDDFGVGYSSMARLLDLEVDEVKIDKSFVFAIADDPRAIAIVRSTVELAAALGLKVVAEGIEDADVLAHVVRAGVDIGQGYVISRPLAGMDYLQFLGNRTRGAVPPPPRTPGMRLPSAPPPPPPLRATPPS